MPKIHHIFVVVVPLQDGINIGKTSNNTLTHTYRRLVHGCRRSSSGGGGSLKLYKNWDKYRPEEYLILARFNPCWYKSQCLQWDMPFYEEPQLLGRKAEFVSYFLTISHGLYFF